MDEKPEKSITRRDLALVVRRAAELADIDDAASDEISEQEVIRIASELGISERHVRQALYEGPRDECEPTLLDRQLGTPRIVTTRAVPFDVARAQKVIEDYLVTCEYLCVVRRQPGSTTFAPAADAVSTIARTFKRSSKHLLAASRAVEVSVRPLEHGWSHVRLSVIFEDKRRGKVTRAMLVGGLLGLPAAGLATFLVGGTTAGVLGGFNFGDLGQQIAIAVGSMFGIATFWGVIAGSLASMRKRYREWREQTVTQAEGALDLLQNGADVRLTPPPWLRTLQHKLGL